MKKTLILFFALTFVSLTQAVTIDECYRSANENYPLVKQYDLIEKSKDYSFSNACRNYLPQFIFSAQATLQSDVTDFPEEMQSMYQRAGINMKGLSYDQYKVMLQMNQIIWDGGTTAAKKRQIEADAEVKRLSIQKEIETIYSRVNQTYFGILMLQEQQKQSLNLKELLLSNLKIIRSKVKNGVAIPSDTEFIQVEVLQLEQKQVKIKNTILAYKQMLGLLTGQEISESEVLEKPQPIELQGENKRTELLLFDSQIKQQKSLEQSIKAGSYPNISLFAQGFYGKPGLNMFDDMLYDEFSWNAIGGIRLQWNLSSFYTKKNSLNNIGLSQSSIENNRSLFEWNIQQQETLQRNEIQKMEDVKTHDTEIVNLRTSIRKASESQYKNGVITINELLRNINNENDAILTQQMHDLELLNNIYNLKTTMNW
ncbi:MAG TPA: TolC family protein [Paludibacteraceae bacterium]|nr:TolC family protein [Paludibacteraceae bacterium]HQF50362.1 TolC family protein [Paludibacteraceae bacterium]HQJ89238.1 TolC family protein [Paludibacteraceae bacterium]